MTVATARGAKGRADKYFSLIIRSRGACENCGDTEYASLQCAHIRSRRYNNTRTYEGNAFCLCASCHFHFTLNPLDFGAFCKKRIGSTGIRALTRRSLSTDKIDWHAEAARLKAIWTDIEAR